MSTLLIGVGNPGRGDDGAGPAVAERLRQDAPAGVEVITLSGEPAALMDAWDGVEHVLLVDSSTGGGPAGRVRCFEAAAGPLPAAQMRNSTHALGVAEAVELARALERLPPRLTVYCIEAGSFEPRGLSPEVGDAVERLACTLRSELGGLGTRGPGEPETRRPREEGGYP